MHIELKYPRKYRTSSIQYQNTSGSQCQSWMRDRFCPIRVKNSKKLAHHKHGIQVN